VEFDERAGLGGRGFDARAGFRAHVDDDGPAVQARLETDFGGSAASVEPGAPSTAMESPARAPTMAEAVDRISG
jgi:hypothetical protein